VGADLRRVSITGWTPSLCRACWAVV